MRIFFLKKVAYNVLFLSVYDFDVRPGRLDAVSVDLVKFAPIFGTFWSLARCTLILEERLIAQNIRLVQPSNLIGHSTRFVQTYNTPVSKVCFDQGGTPQNFLR